MTDWMQDVLIVSLVIWSIGWIWMAMAEIHHRQTSEQLQDDTNRNVAKRLNALEKKP